MQIEFLAAGHCSAFEALASRGAPWKMGRFAAGFSLVTPAEGGTILFDTGYSRHVLHSMRRFPFLLYNLLLPISISLQEEAVAQLAQRGINAGAVNTIIISHFHPDHIGGLRDFPQARFICSRRAWEAVRNLSGWRALREGFLPELLPDDFTQRLIFAEDLPSWPTADGWDGWALGKDLRLVPLDGHAPGQLGLWIESRKVFLIADALWRQSGLKDRALPHPLAMHIHHDQAAYRKTFDKLIDLQNTRPDLHIVATTYGKGS